MPKNDVPAEGHGELEPRDATRLMSLLNQFSVGMTAIVDNAVGTDYASNEEIQCVVALARTGRRTFGELMAVSGLPRRSVAKLVKRMEHSDVVTTARSPRDRRATQVQLTASGRRKVETMSQQLEEFFRDSQPINKEILHLFTSEEAAQRAARQPATGIDLLDVASSDGAEMARAVERRTGGRAVRGRQRVALLQIRANGPTRPGHLAEQVGLTSGGVTYLVDQLEREGLVERHYGADAQDKRTVEIVLTAKGRRSADEVVRGYEDIASTVIHLFATIRDQADS